MQIVKFTKYLERNHNEHIRVQRFRSPAKKVPGGNFKIELYKLGRKVKTHNRITKKSVEEKKTIGIKTEINQEEKEIIEAPTSQYAPTSGHWPCCALCLERCFPDV